MADPAQPTDGVHNQPEYTVAELSFALKRSIEGTFDRVRVRGEISGFKRAASGHLYMSLKDENAVLDAVCWRGTAGRLGLEPEDGLEVVASGKLTTYPARSRYQLVVDAMEVAGEGALLKLLEERRKKLMAEGLFAPERKRETPYLPEVIGVVTSPTGAVIRDILHRLEDRFPRRVLVWPVLVQGEGAAEQIAGAIRGFNELSAEGAVPRPDLLIVARGGGSVEDLWAFNEEVVVRAAADSTIPLISAVGHETDTTLIDFASDKRAPTPTAAAEMAVPVKADLEVSVLDLQRRARAALARLAQERATRLDGLARGLRDPRELVQAHQQRLDDLTERLGRALSVGVERRAANLNVVAAGLRKSALEEKLARLGERTERAGLAMTREISRRRTDLENRLSGLAKLLQSYSYQSVLARGFAVVRSDGGLVPAAAAVTPGADLDIEFRDGRVSAVAGSGGAQPLQAKSPGRKRSVKTRTRTNPDDDPQGSLL